jgi:uracil phosphoribosyltransferase
LIRHKLTLLRDKRTEPKKFRELIREIAILLAYEATQDLAVRDVHVETPMGEAAGHTLTENIGLVPILRAGLGMVEGIWEMMPSAEVWHIGLYRDERTLRPVEYYNKLPVDPTVQVCLVLDPMLATGGSAAATVGILKRWGALRIKFVGILAAPEGIETLSSQHPDVPIHLAAVDERLNDIGYIVPGLGDAGDRQFGTG